MRTIISTSEEVYEYEKDRIKISDAEVKFAYLYEEWDPDYLDKVPAAKKIVDIIAEGTKKVEKSFNPECSGSNVGKTIGPCIGTNESATALRNSIRCYYRDKSLPCGTAQDKSTCCIAVIVGEHGKYNRSESLDKALYWDTVILPELLPATQMPQLVVITQNPQVPTVGSLNSIFPVQTSPNGVQAVIYAGPIRVRGLYSGYWRDVLRAFFEIFFILVTIYMNYDEWRDYRITKAQAYNSQKKYLTNFWNAFDLISILIVYSVAICQFCVVLPLSEAEYQSGGWPKSYRQFVNKTWPGLARLQTLVYGWVINFLFTGGRGFKYFRAHRGLGVYVEVFGRTFKTVQDFLVWLIAILGWLTVAFNLTYTCALVSLQLIHKSIAFCVFNTYACTPFLGWLELT